MQHADNNYRQINPDRLLDLAAVAFLHHYQSILGQKALKIEGIGNAIWPVVGGLRQG